jgi:cytosine/adenosine deaminase-related metal-dependent hydrolase
MVVLGPWILLDGRFRRGALIIEDGAPVEFRPGETGVEDVKGAVLPALANAHTHVGDAFITNPPEGTLEELVSPPDGYKHRRLREAHEDEIAEGMRRALVTAVTSGCTHLTDFREGGLPGTLLLLRSCLGLPLRPTILGRPAEGDGDPRELEALLQVADGIGASGIGDVAYPVLERWSEAARLAGKPFVMHASEGRREDIDAILDLRPTSLVHMTSASPGDLERCADAGVPVAVCPRANARFGLVPDIPGMLDAGITVMLGTDNAMFHLPSMLEEMRYVLGMRWGGERLPPEAILRMAFRPRKVLRGNAGLGVELDQPGDLTVIQIPAAEPRIQDLMAAPGSFAIAVVHDGGLWKIRGQEVVAEEPEGG